MNTLRKTVVSVFILSLLAVGTIVFAEGSDTSAAEAPILNITESELIPEADTEAETDTNADTSIRNFK